MKTVKLHSPLATLTFEADQELCSSIYQQGLVGSEIKFFENYRQTHKAFIKSVNLTDSTITVERALTERSDIDRDLIPSIIGAFVSWKIV